MFTYRSARRRPPLPRPGRPQAAIAAAVALTAVLPASVAWAAGPARSAGAVTGTLGDLTSVAVIPGTTDAWAVGWKCPKEPEGCTPGPDLVLRKGTAGWSAVPAPSPGGQAMLVAVSADSASDAWAVGSDDGGEKNLYLHWNGSAWKQVPGPTPDGSVLTGVTAISPSDALAVGSYTSPSGVTVTLALRWNGKSWAKQATPDPSSSENELLGVTAASATSAWAAGFSLDPQSRNETLILHWNGSTWQQASAPAVASFQTQLSGIAAGSGSDVWAVGQFYSAADADQPLILHWNGTTWSRATLPGAGSKTEVLFGVTSVSPSGAWAVGRGPCVGPSDNCPSRSLTMHWNGTSWKVVGSVSVSDHTDQNSLTGVAAASASDVWAVGDYFPAAESEPFFQMLQQWNGSAWATH
jgi:hypothetical protein